MTVTNKFLENIGINAIRDGGASKPDYIFWAGSDNTFVGDETSVTNDIFHKGVIWASEGIDSRFNMELATTSAIGSYIETYGLIDNLSVGSGNPLVIIPSDVGLKSSTFSVEVEGRILFRRAG